MKPQRTASARFAFQPHMLEAHLRVTLPDLHGGMRIEPLGDSRSSFRIRLDDRTLLLRTQLGGDNLLPLAAALRREYRILDALAATDVPVPKTVLYCDDPQVAGTPFYLAEMPEGRVLSGYALTELPPAQRRAVFFAMAETMARLHRVDWAAAGLADYGRPTRFFAREVVHWTRQQKVSAADGGDMDRSTARSTAHDMTRVGDWLSAHVPDDDETAINHGDFRLGNLVFDPSCTRVVAVFGWERATLGHPLADAAHSCVPWHMDSSATGEQDDTGIRDFDLAEHGIPTQAEYLTHYRQCGGHAESVTTFHLVFALFRAAVAKFGVGARHDDALARRAVELIDGCST